MHADTPLEELCPAGAEAVARKLASVQSTIDSLTVTRDRLAELLDTSHRIGRKRLPDRVIGLQETVRVASVL